MTRGIIVGGERGILNAFAGVRSSLVLAFEMGLLLLAATFFSCCGIEGAILEGHSTFCTQSSMPKVGRCLC